MIGGWQPIRNARSIPIGESYDPWQWAAYRPRLSDA